MKVSCMAFGVVIGFAAQTLVYSQASFELVNHHSPVVNAPIFDSGGVALAGQAYLAELWGAVTPDSLTPLTLFPQGGREIVPFLSDGYFIPTATTGDLVALTVAPRGWAWLQVRAWDARLGTTYEEAVARGLGGYGESPLFYAQGGDPFDLLGVPAPLVGLQSFSLRPEIPEPSAVWLALLGAAAWFLHLRCSRRRRGRVLVAD